MSNFITHITLPNDVEREIIDEKGRNAVLIQNTQPTDDGNKIWVNGEGQVRIPSWEEFQQKANKTRIDFDGTSFKIGTKALTYKELHDIHLVQPDFAFVVYGDRAYLLSYVQDDTSSMREMRFQSVIAVTGSDNTSNVKVSGIYVKSSDGVNFAGEPTVVDVNSENKAYKATEINDSNKNSNVWYPSVKAVNDYVNSANQKLINRLEELEEAAIDNKLYMFREDSLEAYQKDVPERSADFALLDMIGAGKTLVWNQLNNNNTANKEVFKYGVTFDRSVDGMIHVHGTPNEGVTNLFTNVRYITGESFYIPGHKYLFTGASPNVAVFGYNGDQAVGTTAWGKDQIAEAVQKAETDIIRIRVNTYVGEIDEYVYPQVFDLTAMFGAGNEPTAEEFHAMFPAKYYPFSEPTLRIFSPDKVVSSAGQTLDLSALVAKYFPDGMKSAGTVHDEIDLERGVAVQRVGSSDLGRYSTYEQLPSDPNVFYRSIGTTLNTYSNNLLTARYETVDYGLLGTNMPDKTIKGHGTSPRIYIRDTDFNNVDEFVASMSGVILYGELTDPIETPIDPADLVGLEDLSVEAGGSLTFVNDQGDDFRMPLPNKETWMIELGGANG